jgi:hypothetical protein
MCSDFIVGMELIAENSIKKWRDLIGPTKCSVNTLLIYNRLQESRLLIVLELSMGQMV